MSSGNIGLPAPPTGCPICYDDYGHVVATTDDAEGDELRQPFLKISPRQHVCCPHCHCRDEHASPNWILLHKVRPVRRCPFYLAPCDDATCASSTVLCTKSQSDELVHVTKFIHKISLPSHSENAKTTNDNENRYGLLGQRQVPNSTPTTFDSQRTSRCDCTTTSNLDISPGLGMDNWMAPNHQKTNRCITNHYNWGTTADHCSVSALCKVGGCDDIVHPACSCGSHQHLLQSSSSSCLDHRALHRYNKCLRMCVFVLLVVDLIVLSVVTVVWVLLEFGLGDCCCCCVTSWIGTARGCNNPSSIKRRGRRDHGNHVRNNDHSQQLSEEEVVEEEDQNDNLSWWKRKVVVAGSQLNAIVASWEDVCLGCWDENHPADREVDDSEMTEVEV